LAVQGASVKGEIEKVVLANGLVLLLKEDHTLPVVSLNAVFNGGLRQESLAQNGISSLVGSVWTKGLPGESADMINRQIEARGASLSAYSGRNSFVMGMTFLSEDLSFMFDHLEKFITDPVFPQEEIDRDKEQMLTALAARKDNVLAMASRQLVETLFMTHPYRLDSLGTEDSLKRITRKDILSEFQKYIRPDNGVIAVFGDIDKGKVRKTLERRFGRLKPGKPSLKMFSEDLPESLRLKEISLDKQQAAVMFGFRGPLITDKDRSAVDVAVNVLCSSLGGRLFKRVREELGKSYAVSGGSAPGVDAGMITFFALTTDEGAAKVRSIMEEEFSKLRTELISDKELADAKIYLISKMARDTQTIAAQSITRAVDELLGLGYQHLDGEAARLSAVTREDVRSAAGKYLDLAHAAFVRTRSLEKKTRE
jgi:zinc protease